MKSNLLLILIFTFIQYIHGEEIICELKGSYETTYSIPSRNYLQDIGDALKNFTAGPYTPFLVDKAKANIFPSNLSLDDGSVVSEGNIISILRKLQAHYLANC